MLSKVVFLFTLFLAVFGTPNPVQVAEDTSTAVQGAEEFPACRCVFYEHCGYQGKRYCYNGNTRWVGGSSNDKFSSVRVTPGWICKVFEHSNYGGKSLIFRNSDSCLTNNKLNNKSWNDKISSIQILQAACRCRFYEHCNFKGKSVCYNRNTRWVGGVANDKFSAVKVASGTLCKVFEHSNYGGKSLIFTRSDSCLTNNKLGSKSWNDKISSVKILKACRCQFYEHCNFKGKSVCYNGNTPFVGGVANDKFSAVKVEKGWKCTAYEHWKYKGLKTTFYANDRCLTNNPRRNKSWNDVISSVRVDKHNPCPCKLYQHCGYHGYSRCFQKSTQWVGSGHNDQYSAIRVGRGYKCQIFQHHKFRGHRLTFTRDDDCFLNNKLGKGSFNDVTSSIRVSRAHTVGLLDEDDDTTLAQEQEQEQEQDYMRFAVGGVVILSIAGLGLFAYKQRKGAHKQYEALLQQVTNDEV